MKSHIFIDCVNDRLENLKAQFNGTADKTTQQKGDRSGNGSKAHCPAYAAGEFCVLVSNIFTLTAIGDIMCIACRERKMIK